MKKILFLLLIINLSLSAQSFNRNILVEIFTNSHCPLCPPAYSTIDSYLASSADPSKIKLVFYHMSFPYPDDPLNQANTSDPQARNNYYGPFSGTPRGMFDGETQANNYSSWSSILDNKLALKSYIDISLSGTREGNSMEISAEVNMDNNIPQGDPVIHFIVIEDVNYLGRNGIQDHKNVMRKMVTGPDGQNLPITDNQTIEKTISLENNWIPENLGVLVFVQYKTSKVVYQSDIITYNDLLITSIEENPDIPHTFELFQNYPNPFNPNTTIKYEIASTLGLATAGPVVSTVSLRIYDILGREIKTLVNEKQNPGYYEIEFNADNLPSGVYLYRLQVANPSASLPAGQAGSGGDFVQTKRMILLK